LRAEDRRDLVEHLQPVLLHVLEPEVRGRLDIGLGQRDLGIEGVVALGEIGELGVTRLQPFNRLDIFREGFGKLLRHVGHGRRIPDQG